MNLTPVSHEELRTRLRRGVVTFAFKKLNGDLRTAIGTTDLAEVPREFHPAGRGESSDKVVVFFDKEKRQWRSLSKRVEVFML